MITIGLTGGIASGKSTVSSIFKKRGIPVIDADKIAREIVAPGSNVLYQIIEEFGNEVLLENGELDRKKLRNIVFNDEVKLNRLNEIMHPQIKSLIMEKKAMLKEINCSICVVDAALLIEAGFSDLVDVVIVVYVDLETQIKRLTNRDNITKKDALKIIKSQMSIEEKLKYADYIIDNSKDIEYTYKQVNKIISSLKTLEDSNE